MCGSVGWVGTPHASSFNKFKIFNKLLAFENGLERSDEVQRESRKTALVEKKFLLSIQPTMPTVTAGVGLKFPKCETRCLHILFS